MSEPAPPPDEVFTGLRDRFFRADHAAMAPAEPDEPPPEAGLEVVGVVMEMGLPRGICLVYGLRDGSASMYFSSGGAIIGGQGRARVNAAAKAFVRAARPLAASMTPATDYPPPDVGRARFWVFTTTGVRTAEAGEAEVCAGPGEWVPLYAAGQDVITAFRLVDQRIKAGEPPEADDAAFRAEAKRAPLRVPNAGVWYGERNDEPGYINCLLTTLAKGGPACLSATLTAGRPPPDPAGLTADPEQRKWIGGIGFDFGRLNTTTIIRKLLDMAEFRRVRFWKREGFLLAKLAVGGQLALVVFRVRRRSGGCVEVKFEPVTVGPGW